MRRLLAASVLLCALTSYRPAPSAPDRCAHALGVHYTSEDGATDRLDAFSRCVRA